MTYSSLLSKPHTAHCSGRRRLHQNWLCRQALQPHQRCTIVESTAKIFLYNKLKASNGDLEYFLIKVIDNDKCIGRLRINTFCMLLICQILRKMVMQTTASVMNLVGSRSEHFNLRFK